MRIIPNWEECPGCCQSALMLLLLSSPLLLFGCVINAAVSTDNRTFEHEHDLHREQIHVPEYILYDANFTRTEADQLCRHHSQHLASLDSTTVRMAASLLPANTTAWILADKNNKRALERGVCFYLDKESGKVVLTEECGGTARRLVLCTDVEVGMAGLPKEDPIIWNDAKLSELGAADYEEDDHHDMEL